MHKRNNHAFVLALAAAGILTTVSCAHRICSSDCPPSSYEGAKFHGQFYEDYVLSVVFSDVEAGFYVDVGANDPDNHNLTRYFYERGWRGVNIEPNVSRYKDIVKARPRDKNYNYGIANTDATMTFYQAAHDQDGLSSFDKENVERLRKERNIDFTEVSVQVTTLSKVLAMASVPKINFMSIDVEGFEKQAIESLDFSRYKPEVLCIEATQPFTDIPSYSGWEEILFKNNYVFAMFDGLNRYYVHKDRADLLLRFIEADRCVKRSKYARKVRMDAVDGWH